ncbi:carbohydrate-binding module family 50 protein [Trichoderma citrinoviride]|uniref:Carbohydrate-binding module family 50 protein n=1 Tax=Trichoderma citrinoviride TaxID=58853 RepID=A0A2T4B7I1_9HYPO|nr:carbohydrate-binding module family 50 protein [Trichoderma citrinoviride]PTB65189.1 carbohydrate-binding module family 50 protein [Trichoderma citrinoviride]
MLAAAVCLYILVKSGDSCAGLASRCGISGANLTKYNPSSTLCSTLKVGEPVCCSSGSLSNLTPRKNTDGTCASYTVKSGDHCALIAQNNYITADNIEMWAGLTPTTTSAGPTLTASWTIVIYSEPDCAGDYYSVEGYNLDSPDDECLVLRGGGIPTTSDTGTTCRWFTNGGFDWDDCSTSTLTQPLSWSVLGGVCTAYDTDTCTDDGNADAYDPAQGCHNHSASNLDTKTWVSLQCGAQPAIGDGELFKKPLQIVNSPIVVNGKGSKGNYTSVMTKPIDPTLHKAYRFHPKPTPTGRP